MTIEQRLRDIRTERGLSQEALAAAVLIAVGITIGALFFRESPEDFVSISELESEVIDGPTIRAPLLPLD